ncbi:MAG TPA: 6-phosphogluconolactonase [Gemmatimonadaceae bacterium]|nr:6-phosphogluconolactonase [Gemmatimonadaceae bacterium]
MREETLPDAESVAHRAAQVIAEDARRAVAARGRFLLATSGGTTPWRMLRLLVDEDVPWSQVHLFQVDERVAPEGHPDRNLTHLRESLLAHLPVPPAGIYAMPVNAPDLERAAAEYAATLHNEAGNPPVLDLVHLGLGEDGHTASIVPGDARLTAATADVAATATYAGYRRLTLTVPAINRARAILWVVTGAAKGPALARLRHADRLVPAGRIRRDGATILNDAAADLASLSR